MTPSEHHELAFKAMQAAIDYCRVQLTGMTWQEHAAENGHLEEHLVTVDAALTSIARDADAENLDITGAMAAIALRAAELSRQMTGTPVEEFLGTLEAELHPPGESPDIPNQPRQ